MVSTPPAGDSPPVPDDPSSGHEPIYQPAADEPQGTVRAIAVGCVTGAFVAAMNVSFGLRIGWTIGGSLIAAILSYSIFAFIIRPRRPFTPLETNIAQTTGSAAGCMISTAGMVAAIPAVTMLGRPLSYGELTLWAGSVAWLGIFYAVPLRRQMILVDRLRFPTGTATAHTIMAMFSSGRETLRKSRTLALFAVGAAVYTVAAYFVPELERPPLTEYDRLLPVALFGIPAAYGFSLLISPMMLGGGVLVGPRVALSLGFGAIVAWAVVAPGVESMGWVTGGALSYRTGARGWLLWPGVALMVTDALTHLALAWRSVSNLLTSLSPARRGRSVAERDAIPPWAWMVGLLVATALTVVSAWWIFAIPPVLSVLAVALSSVLAIIATRAMGETDLNPTGGVAKVTQLAFGGVAPGQMTTNLMAAGITAASASQAADMMQDLKTGHLLGASPRTQLVAQICGVAAGIAIAVPVFQLFTTAYQLGGDKLPAPAALAWRAMAEVLSQGASAMPAQVGWAVIIAGLCGVALPLARRWVPSAHWLPSGLAIGIAFIVPAAYSIIMVIGGLAYLAWRRASPGSAKALGFAVASGLVVGEGLMAIVTALFQLAGIPTLADIL